MYKAFFPDVAFAWAYCALLISILALAAVVDFRRMVIPKAITLSLLGLGVCLSIVRGSWLGSHGEKVWLLPSGMWLGALDGFLFALAGFVVSFLIIFVLWVLNTCGGGDVKLFAALGVWLGPTYGFYVLAVSLVVLAIVVVVKVLALGVSRRTIRKLNEVNRPATE